MHELDRKRKRLTLLLQILTVTVCLHLEGIGQKGLTLIFTKGEDGNKLYHGTQTFNSPYWPECNLLLWSAEQGGMHFSRKYLQSALESRVVPACPHGIHQAWSLRGFWPLTPLLPMLSDWPPFLAVDQPPLLGSSFSLQLLESLSLDPASHSRQTSPPMVVGFTGSMPDRSPEESEAEEER